MSLFRKHFFLVVIAALSLPAVSIKSIAFAAAKTANSNSAGVLIGPLGSPNAEGPTGRDDDFTNLSIDDGIPASSNGGTVSPAVKIFKNTVENTGPADDAYIIATPSIPAGFRVEISTDFGGHYTAIDSTIYSITIPVAYRAANTLLVRVTAPAGLRILNSYDTVIRATSTIDPAVTNETIDRLYAGFIRLDATMRVISGGQTIDEVRASPGSEIEFTIAYTNISSGKGNGNSLLTACNLVISENGNAAPNSWGATTDHIVGASDNQGGYIVGDREGSTWLTDIVTSLDPGQAGVFKFRRRIK